MRHSVSSPDETPRIEFKIRRAAEYFFAVLIINIHKSRAVTLYLIEHRILMRGGFIKIKVQTFYFAHRSAVVETSVVHRLILAACL